jgi:hypothetical protein
VLELDERLFRPERGAKSIACNYLARAVEQETKDTVWLLLEFDPNAALAQFDSPSIQLEDAETMSRGRTGRLSHSEVSLALMRQAWMGGSGNHLYVQTFFLQEVTR